VLRSKKNKSSKSPLPFDGRKYRLVIFSMALILGAFGLTALNPVLATLFPEFITGIISLNFLYMGGNVSNKWVLNKAGKLTLPPEDKPKE
jgi:hypothetical protein